MVTICPFIYCWYMVIGDHLFLYLLMVTHDSCRPFVPLFIVDTRWPFGPLFIDGNTWSPFYWWCIMMTIYPFMYWFMSPFVILSFDELWSIFVSLFIVIYCDDHSIVLWCMVTISPFIYWYMVTICPFIYWWRHMVTILLVMHHGHHMSNYTTGYFRSYFNNKPAFHNLSIIYRIKPLPYNL